MVYMSFFMVLNILIIITLNSMSDKLLASISFSSSGVFSRSFIWGLHICQVHITAARKEETMLSHKAEAKESQAEGLGSC